jgi:hypothetical protein
MPPNSSATRVEIERTNLTEHGQRYRAMLDAIQSSMHAGRCSPEASARVWRQGKTSADMQLDIEKGADLAIEKSHKKSIRLRRWVPMPVSRARGEATAAISGVPVQKPVRPKRPPETLPADEASLSR